MSFISQFLHSFIHTGVHTAAHETMEKLHAHGGGHAKVHEQSEAEKAFDFEVQKMTAFKADKKDFKLREQLFDCLAKNYIPKEILVRHLYFAVDLCIANDRRELVEPYLPYYMERKKNFRKVRFIKGAVFFFETLIPFLFRLAIFLFFLYLVYLIFWGAQ